MNRKPIEINSERLKNLLDGINQFGFNPVTGGYNRSGFTQADMDGRNWFSGQLMQDGLAVSRDNAGNVFGRLGADGKPCIMVGSHIDTVPEGGAFDGALGAAIGLECVRCIKEHAIETKHPIVVVATSEEEGRFGGMLGSQAISGQLTDDWIDTAQDADGVKLMDVMRSQGLDPSRLHDAAWASGSIIAFLELHVEQGPVLEEANVSIGLVEGVSGVLVLSLELNGVANHSGTTPMDLRSDAFAGLAQIAAQITGMIEGVGTDQSRVTIGKVTVEPNFPHTIPGYCTCTVIIRDTSSDVMANLRKQLEETIESVSKQHHLQYRVEQRSYIGPMQLDQSVRSVIATEATALGYDHKFMPSGAGHDAQTMQAFCPSGLIFVPSRGGVSHAPEEWTDWSDIERGAQLMLNTILRLSTSE